MPLRFNDCYSISNSLSMVPADYNPKIPYSDILTQFDFHLKYDKNHRIIFSGKFGSGKTTFLHHYFEENKDNFVPIYLYPVNYSISSNEDIFELIKYDILLELLSKDDILNIENTKF